VGGEAWVVAVVRALDVQFLKGRHMGGGSTVWPEGQCSRLVQRDRGWCFHVGMMSGSPVVDGVWGVDGMWGVERRARNRFQGREHGRLCQGDGDVCCVGLSARGGVVGSGIVRDLRRCDSRALRELGTGLGLGLAHAVVLALAPSFARRSAASLPGISNVGMPRNPNNLRGCVSKEIERMEEGLDRPDEGSVCLCSPLVEDDIDSIAIVDKNMNL
jgi:hypothetical protein